MYPEQIEHTLNYAASIIVVPSGDIFHGDASKLISTTKFRILAGSNHRKVIIIDQFQLECDDYILYELTDFGKTWGFTVDDLVSWRSDFLADLAAMNPLKKIDILRNQSIDPRLLDDVQNSLESDFAALYSPTSTI